MRRWLSLAAAVLPASRDNRAPSGGRCSSTSCVSTECTNIDARLCTHLQSICPANGRIGFSGNGVGWAVELSSPYRYLATRLGEKGLVVQGLGEEETLVAACKKLIYVALLREAPVITSNAETTPDSTVNHGHGSCLFRVHSLYSGVLTQIYNIIHLFERTLLQQIAPFFDMRLHCEIRNEWYRASLEN